MRIFLTHDPQMLDHYFGDKAMAQIEKLGEISINDLERPLSSDELIRQAKDADIVLADRLNPGTTKVFESLPNLIAFVRDKVDVSNIDLNAANTHGVLVTHVGPGFMAACSELVIGYMIDLTRRITDYTLAYRNGRIEEESMGRELAGSSVGIIGYGMIGKYLAHLCQAIGMRVLIYTPTSPVTEPGLIKADFDSVVRESDYLICLAKSSPETENLINEQVFKSMKASAYFINISRGELVDDEALEEAIVNGEIAGAALDVGRDFDQRPTRRIAKLPRVIATPHIGALTPESIEFQALEAVKHIKEIIEGKVPDGALNVKYAFRFNTYIEKLMQH
jgi:D-3-phosphoglycerate dehydrogenase